LRAAAGRPILAERKRETSMAEDGDSGEATMRGRIREKLIERKEGRAHGGIACSPADQSGVPEVRGHHENADPRLEERYG
jgi:hypothetical protein